MIPEQVARSASAFVASLLKRLSASGAPASQAPDSSAVEPTQKPPNEQVQAWLGACMATRKAWDAGATMSRVNPALVRELKTLLADGDAAAIAAKLADIAGPVHPGDPKLAAEPWVARSTQLLQACLEAFLKPAVALRDMANEAIDKMPRARKAANPKGSVDLDDVKLWIVHWIEHGRLPDRLPVWFTDTITSHKLQKIVDGEVSVGWDEAKAIAEFLEQARSGDRGAVPGNLATSVAMTGAGLRCAVVATAAPAIESAIVMSRMSESFLDVLQSQKALRDMSAEQAKQELNKALRDSPMFRGAEDDKMVDGAFRRMFADTSELASRMGRAGAGESAGGDEEGDADDDRVAGAEHVERQRG